MQESPKNIPKSFNCLLFDLDGTLADSIDCLRSTFFTFSDYFELELTNDDFCRFNGPRIADIVHQIQRENFPHLDLQKMINIYFEILNSKFLLAPPITGAQTLIGKAKLYGKRVGIVTSNTRELTSDWLSKNSFSNYVDFMVTAGDVKFGKPDPEPYNLAVQLSGTERAYILAVEDSVQGAKSALSAGLTTYLVSPEQSRLNNLNLIKVHDLTTLYEILLSEWKTDSEA